MTTVTYRDGVMAADSRSCGGDFITAPDVRKVWKSIDGRLIAVTGDFAYGSAFARWLLHPESRRGTITAPALSEHSRCIEVIGPTEIRIHEIGGYFNVRGSCFAWGSGTGPALGALYMGADAVTAVRVACKIDPGSGGRIRKVSL